MEVTRLHDDDQPFSIRHCNSKRNNVAAQGEAAELCGRRDDSIYAPATKSLLCKGEIQS